MNALDVLYADNHLLVVNKPACLPIVPDDSGDESLFELAKAWVKREYDKPGEVYLGVVHRLDRPVSGVVLFARTSKAADRLSSQFRERTVDKIYWGVVAGRPDPDRGEVRQHLWKDGARNLVQVVAADRDGARPAHTSYRSLRSVGGHSLIELRPHSGRSHQLRVACATLGMPLLGDLKYGASEPLPDRSIALHARRIEVKHPTREELMAWESELPALDVWRRMSP